MKIKNFKEFNESISGTEITVPFGPAYGRQVLRTTLDKTDTKILKADGFHNPDAKNPLLDDIYSMEEYSRLYNLYLKMGGKVLNGNLSENLPIILQYIETNQ